MYLGVGIFRVNYLDMEWNEDSF